MDISSIIYPIISLGGMGLLFGLGLGYAGKKFQVEEDPKLPLLREILPGANCGGCGQAGCDAFADALLQGKASVNGCVVGGESCAQQLAEVMGVEAGNIEKHVAFIRCGGDCNKSKSRYDYYGMRDCYAMSQLAGGGAKECSYGCLGGGSCFHACNFGAISMVDGIAVVDRDKCTACGQCVEACPKSLIELVPYRNEVHVACHSNDNGKVTKGNCSVGCIGCKLCEKACGFDAVHVENFLSRIDYDKCTMCNACVKKCPMATIQSLTYKKEEVIAKEA